MNIKSVIALAVVSAFFIAGCSTQNKKPLPGSGQSGSMADHSHEHGIDHEHGPDSHTHGNLPGQRGGGSNAGQGGSGVNQDTNSGGSGAGGFGNSGQGGFGAGQKGQVRDGAGAFGSGSAYSGNTKSAYTLADLRDTASILAQRVIYFGYNQSGIEPQYRRILDAHASLLRDFPELNVRLEGHADERGSREYNVALSERRAFAVRDYMQIKGVQKGQTDVVGYGEEVPAVFGHGEGSWSKNRRVEIIYAGE